MSKQAIVRRNIAVLGNCLFYIASKNEKSYII